MAIAKAKALLAVLLFLSLSLLSAASVLSYDSVDPRRRLEKCQQECRQSRLGEAQRRQCEQRCEEEYRSEQGRSRGDDLVEMNRDPQERLRQCKQKCWQQQRDPRQVQQCEMQCEQRYEEERGRHVMNRDPEEELRQCERRCDQLRGDTRQQEQCQRRCEERYQEELERRERGRDGVGNRDPREEYRRCQQRCEEERRDPRKQQQCQWQCEKQYREEREREREEGGRSESGNRDPREEYRQCEEDCQQQYRDPRKMRQCRSRCEGEYIEHERRGREGREDPAIEMVRQSRRKTRRGNRRREEDLKNEHHRLVRLTVGYPSPVQRIISQLFQRKLKFHGKAPQEDEDISRFWPWIPLIA